MEAILNRVLNIDKSNWESVRFGDVVEEPKEKSNDFEADGIKHIVGLEHIDSEDIHLRRSATTEESTTFTKRFRPSDVLFGRRRAYLKKAALAEFDGVCSGDITVFRAKPSLMPELLPFIVNNDKFFDFAVKHSAGGLSPRVKFRDLANYEFLLPPKEQQPQLAELLWAMDEVIETEKKTRLKLAQYLDAVSGRIFSRSVLKFAEVLPFDIKREKWTEHILDDLCDLVTDGAHASPKSVVGGYPIGTVENMLKSKIDISACRTIGQEDFEYLKRNNCKPLIGDVLFSKDGTIGKTFVFNQEDDLVLLSSIAIIRTKQPLLEPNYCSLMLESPVFMTEIEKRKSGTALKRVVLKDIKKFRINLPSIEFQKMVSRYLISLKTNVSYLENKISDSQDLQRSLINQVF